MNVIYPNKLSPGDGVRIVAPSGSAATLPASQLAAGIAVLERLGLKVSLSANVYELDSFDSSDIYSRVEDLHEAFLDSSVKAVLCARGGFYANQLLDYVDWSIVKANPKIFYGFSDITALQNAMLARTGLVTYSGPNLSYLGRPNLPDYTLEYLKKCLFTSTPFSIEPYKGASQSVYGVGWKSMNEGESSGMVVGGNLCTLNLLQGTKFMPSLDGAILFLEDDVSSNYRDLDRNLQSIMHLPDFTQVNGVVFGCFEEGSGITLGMLEHLVAIRPALQKIPVLANVDFGHRDGQITFPIGGEVRVVAGVDCGIQILRH